MMSLWDALRMNMMISYQELVRTFLRDSGDMLYTWQYDIRWAAQQLRNEGTLKPVNRRRDLPWELA